MWIPKPESHTWIPNPDYWPLNLNSWTQIPEYEYPNLTTEPEYMSTYLNVNTKHEYLNVKTEHEYLSVNTPKPEYPHLNTQTWIVNLNAQTWIPKPGYQKWIQIPECEYWTWIPKCECPPEYPNLTLLHLDTQTHLSRNTEPQCSTSKDLQIFIYLIDSTKYITFSLFLKLGNGFHLKVSLKNLMHFMDHN